MVLSGCSPPQMWVQERLPLARSTEHGTDLPSVQRLAKRNEVSLGAVLAPTTLNSPFGATQPMGDPHCDTHPAGRRCRRSWGAMPPAWPRC